MCIWGKVLFSSIVLVGAASFGDIRSIGYDFVAPVINDKGDAPNQTGLIVFDSTDESFYGNHNGVWKSFSDVPVSSILSISSSYTVSVSDDIVLCDASLSAFTINLPSGSGNSGLIISFKKTDSSNNAITIDGSGSETIDGNLTTSLDTQFESIQLVNDGTNWHLMSRNIPSEWASYTPTYTGFGAVTSSEFKYRRVGDSIEVTGSFVAGTPTGVEGRISFPTGLTSSNSKIQSLKLVGFGTLNSNADLAPTVLGEPGVTYFTFGFQGPANSGATKLNGSSLLGIGDKFYMKAQIPIQNWKN